MKRLMFLVVMAVFSVGCVTTNSHNVANQAQKTMQNAKYERILDYLGKAQKFTYVADQELFHLKDYWQNPDEVEKNQAGDCEDKALWLYSKLIEEGYSDIRLVIGKLRVKDKINHMWVAWHVEGETLILDTTLKSGPLKSSELPDKFYKPLYSYYKSYKWEHIS